MTDIATSTTAPGALGRVLDLAPAIAARSAEVEHDRALPPDLLATLTEAGCFRMLSPRAHGGDELPLADAVRVVGALARADSAVGWTVGQHCSAQLLVTALPAAGVAAVYADGPDVRCAGAVAPKGRALAVEGGWRVSGRWPFVTGCRWSSWIYANCVVPGAAGPQVRMVLFPAAQVEVVDTWTVAGLRGTGSHDVVIQGLCPSERSCAFAGDAAGVVTEHPRLLHGAFFLAAVSLGIAARAVDEVLADGSRAAAHVGALGAAHMAVRAGEALLAAEVADAGGHATPLARAQALATAATVTATAKRVVTDLFAVSGSAAVYDSSPLQRLLRDVHVAGQHLLNRPQTVDAVGTALVG